MVTGEPVLFFSQRLLLSSFSKQQLQNSLVAVGMHPISQLTHTLAIHNCTLISQDF